MLDLTKKPFEGLAGNRLEVIQKFIDVLNRKFDVRVVKQTSQYCRLDFYEDDPRWIRLYPMRSQSYFIAAFYVEKSSMGEHERNAALIGIETERGNQPESEASDRLRVRVYEYYDASHEQFGIFLGELRRSYERIRSRS